MVREARLAWDDEEGFDLRHQRSRLQDLEDEDPFFDTFPLEEPVLPKPRRRRRNRAKQTRRKASPTLNESGPCSQENGRRAQTDQSAEESREETP